MYPQEPKSNISESLKERLRNIERLRREAEAKMLHADVLQAETDFLIRTGKLLREDETLP
jgi:HAMP domain-containing protein